MMTRTFPSDFIFGASTAAYQIEGAWNVDGKGESIWDRMSHTPGKIRNNDTGDVACDHYNRMDEDLDLLKTANLTAYRFSINWTRILPNGIGQVNEAGLAFYDRLIDGCLARGITPWICLYHWDYSQVLQDQGGWANRSSVDWYLEFTKIVVERYKDRVKNWIMFNEPCIFLGFGYFFGIAPPELRDASAFGAAVHHMSLATGDGARLIRQLDPLAKVGTVLNLAPFEAISDAPADLKAAKTVDNFMNATFLDPIFRGSYPEPVASYAAPHIHSGDMERVRIDLDFLGINHYARGTVAGTTDAKPGKGAFAALTDLGVKFQKPPEGTVLTDMGWEIYPQGIYDILTRVARDYGPIPLYITENGGAFPDVVTDDGRIHDIARTDLLDGYISAVHQALADGVDVRGYFVWSLLDNFEWNHGYAIRFGLVHMDYETLQRRPKDSYFWYSELARTLSLETDKPAAFAGG